MTLVQSRQYISHVTFNTTDLSTGHLPDINVASHASLRHPLPDASLTNSDSTFPYGLGSIFYQMDLYSNISLGYNEGLSLQRVNLADQQLLTDSQNVLPRILRPAGEWSIDRLLTTDDLVKLSRDYVQRAIALAAHYGLQVEDHDSVEGVLVVDTNRLVVQRFAVRLMEGLGGVIIVLLLLIIVLLLLIIVMHPSATMPADPALLAGALFLLRRRGRLQ
ncbi:hypothetical protein LTR70_008121 [Exophiala xenobiotica]|uniref:Uncharacterized protein n=1 Tax=Lithohypha guttulata TaxID=1690604 RepID=A0ABR0JXZ9_9EURO|nr:hypothetical protein LTR24_009181 [Lithohypha guttulata]KAK5312524.1 hypothetical protein LTR70_008121 [Exophiala xenobiotica]